MANELIVGRGEFSWQLIPEGGAKFSWQMR